MWVTDVWFVLFDHMQCCATLYFCKSPEVYFPHQSPTTILFAQRCQVINIFRCKNNWGLVEGHLLILVNVIVSAVHTIISFLSTDLIWSIFAHMYIFCFSVMFETHQHWLCHRHFEWAVTLYLKLHGLSRDVCFAINLNNWLPVICT